jgi:hydroxymethylglutaryl-CoA lyase
MLKLIECPRDAMQGIQKFIPTDKKVAYLNALLRVGFDTLDFGSFVSGKVVPQLADTAEVLAGLELSGTSTKLLAIVANLRGAEEAAGHGGIRYLGYPFSISETFQLRNTRRTIAESMELVAEMRALCNAAGKVLVVYISMGFGNPYGDPWSPILAGDWVQRIVDLGVSVISLSDTVGTADASTIGSIFREMIPRFPTVEFGAHFHSTPEMGVTKLRAAWEGGCRRFDSAMMGFGGCPFAEDELVGNISTESVVHFLGEVGSSHGLNTEAFGEACEMAATLFNQYR